MFHQDNARPHTARITSQKVEELGWEKIPHPPYSPDLAASDYHLFRSLQNHLKETAFATPEEVKMPFVSSSTQNQKNFTIMELISLLINEKRLQMMMMMMWFYVTHSPFSRG